MTTTTPDRATVEKAVADFIAARTQLAEHCEAPTTFGTVEDACRAILAQVDRTSLPTMGRLWTAYEIAPTDAGAARIVRLAASQARAMASESGRSSIGELASALEQLAADIAADAAEVASDVGQAAKAVTSPAGLVAVGGVALLVLFVLSRR